MKCLAAVALSVAAFSAFADQTPPARPQPSPAEIQKVMDTAFGSVIPMMTKMTDAMLEATLQRAEDPKTAQRVAKFKKNLYDALIQEGFSKEQAFSIMQNTALPSAAPMMK